MRKIILIVLLIFLTGERFAQIKISLEKIPKPYYSKPKINHENLDKVEEENYKALIKTAKIKRPDKSPVKEIIKKKEIVKNNKELDYVIKSKAKKYNIDYKLIRAIISHESRWDKYALGKSKDKGLMQVMSYNMTKKEQEDPYSFENNIEAGTRYLRSCFSKFVDLKTSVSCYNRGRNGKYNPAYVNAIMKYYKP